jgi:hypothetical protein
VEHDKSVAEQDLREQPVLSTNTAERSNSVSGAQFYSAPAMPRDVAEASTAPQHQAVLSDNNVPTHHNPSGTNASRFLTDNATGECPSTCFGASCDGWTNTCSELESAYGCDCGGCICPTAPLIISSESGTVSVATFESLQGAMLTASLINVTSPAITVLSRLIVPTGASIEISSAVSAVLNGAGSTRVCFVESDASLKLKSLILEDGAVGNCDYESPCLDCAGAAVYVASGGSLELVSCAVHDMIGYRGGAVFELYATLTISGSTFEENYAGGAGGAVYPRNSTASISGSTFQNNSAADEGGGVCLLFGSTLTISDSTFQSNSAKWGGGVWGHIDSALTISDSSFVGNSAANAGGGVCLHSGSTLTIPDSAFQSNSASYGGGVYGTIDSALMVSDSSFVGNSAATHGGGVCGWRGSVLVISGSVFQSNSANLGGGAYGHFDLALTISGSTFAGNSAATDGGGVCGRTESAFAIAESTFEYNSAASGSGGTVYSFSLAIANSAFQHNSALRSRGGALIAESQLSVTGSSFIGNSANEVRL